MLLLLMVKKSMIRKAKKTYKQKLVSRAYKALMNFTGKTAYYNLKFSQQFYGIFFNLSNQWQVSWEDHNVPQSVSWNWLTALYADTDFFGMVSRYKLYQIMGITFTLRRAIADFSPGLFGANLVSIRTLPQLSFSPRNDQQGGQPAYDDPTAFKYDVVSEEKSNTISYNFPPHQANSSYPNPINYPILGSLIWNAAANVAGGSSYINIGYDGNPVMSGDPGSLGSFPLGRIDLTVHLRFCRPNSI